MIINDVRLSWVLHPNLRFKRTLQRSKFVAFSHIGVILPKTASWLDVGLFYNALNGAIQTFALSISCINGALFACNIERDIKTHNFRDSELVISTTDQAHRFGHIGGNVIAIDALGIVIGAVSLQGNTRSVLYQHGRSLVQFDARGEFGKRATAAQRRLCADPEHEALLCQRVVSYRFPAVNSRAGSPQARLLRGCVAGGALRGRRASRRIPDECVRGGGGEVK